MPAAQYWPRRNTDARPERSAGLVPLTVVVVDPRPRRRLHVQHPRRRLVRAGDRRPRGDQLRGAATSRRLRRRAGLDQRASQARSRVGTARRARAAGDRVGPGLGFISKIDDVQQSSGRLSSPVFPGEALGIWPEGDFRIVRGDVAGATPGGRLRLRLRRLSRAVALIRRREWALLSVLGVAAVVVYGLARPFAEIHVEAKALCVLAPILTLIIVRWLLAPAERARRSASHPSGLRRAACSSSPLRSRPCVALRAAPVSFDQRAEPSSASARRSRASR